MTERMYVTVEAASGKCVGLGYSVVDSMLSACNEKDVANVKGLCTYAADIERRDWLYSDTPLGRIPRPNADMFFHRYGAHADGTPFAVKRDGPIEE